MTFSGGVNTKHWSEIALKNWTNNSVALRLRTEELNKNEVWNVGKKSICIINFFLMIVLNYLGNSQFCS